MTYIYILFVCISGSCTHGSQTHVINQETVQKYFKKTNKPVSFEPVVLQIQRKTKQARDRVCDNMPRSPETLEGEIIIDSSLMSNFSFEFML